MELDCAENSLCNSGQVGVANLSATCCHHRNSWNKSQDIKTVLIKWVEIKGKNPRHRDCTVSSHVRSFVCFMNAVVQRIDRFEGQSQSNFIVHIFFTLNKEQVQFVLLSD
jgi:hypothetical protein